MVNFHFLDSETIGGFFPKPKEATQLFSKLAEESLSKKQEENQAKIVGGTSLDLGQQPVITKPGSETIIKATEGPTEFFFGKLPEGNLFSKTSQGNILFHSFSFSFLS